MTTTTYPTKTERLYLRRNCTPNPYERGFEDVAYPGAGGLYYRNVYAVGSEAYREYDRGFKDGQRARQESRP